MTASVIICSCVPHIRVDSSIVVVVFILQQDNTQNIKPEGQQGSEALTATRNKKCLEQILATTHNDRN